MATFEYCSFNGPPNDPTQADEAPAFECEPGGAGNWARLWNQQVDTESCLGSTETGVACINFGIVKIPRVVGFRFRYTGQGSGIANGVSAPADFTWTAQ